MLSTHHVDRPCLRISLCLLSSVVGRWGMHCLLVRKGTSATLSCIRILRMERSPQAFTSH